MTNEERKAALEAIIYAADEPATVEQLTKALGEQKLAVEASLDELVASYAAEERRSEEHTSELQSQSNLVCRLLLEKKKQKCESRPGLATILHVPDHVRAAAEDSVYDAAASRCHRPRPHAPLPSSNTHSRVIPQDDI